ncbi:hypothetical protein [uncultured Shimia sp.]|uniref:hypothetical protein n=1 Tax=uncultured Shimia sp. TaxID=573152 RepID=UPI002607BEAA|nr:hypothetical protein [uncultured Shimia sp.]
MTRNHWHILREGNILTMTRALPVRFDVRAETTMPDGSRLRLAQQVRQDLWRRLQTLRGFAPAVQVTRVNGACRIVAGGRVDAVHNKRRLEDSIAEMLADPALRHRWSSYAAHREVVNV